MMKKLLCALLTLLLVFGVTAALAEYCEYGNEESPCDIGWQVDHVGQKHRRVCTNHVEDKEDPFSYMPVTDWESCTPDEGGKCTTCGYDYIREPDANDYEKYMLEYYYVYTEMMGKSPVNVDVSDGKITITLDEGFFEFLDEMGVPYGESLMVGSELTLSSVNGAFKVMASEYGPLSWLEKYGKLSVGSVNITDGVASVNVVVDGKTYNLTKNVGGQTPDTPDEEGTEYCKYGSASSPCDIRWDADKKTHASFCMNHVEEKDDPYSYVQVTDWEPCTFRANEYICDTCGADYTPSSEPDQNYYDAIMTEIYYKLLERNGKVPLEISEMDGYVSIALSEQFIMYMMEYGVPVTDAIKGQTICALTLTDGTEYIYEGRPVFPNVRFDVSPEGPGTWLQRRGLLVVDSEQYENNQAPGIASVKTQMFVNGMNAITLKTNYNIVSAATVERCKYYSPDSPCDVIWWVDSDTRLHCRACRNHVEDKEDMYSYVQITGWAACTLDDGGECTTCGWDYVKEPDVDNSEIYMLEFYMMLSMEYGTAPVDVSVSGSSLTISMADDFFTFMEDMGVPVSETMMVKTTYTLTLPDGTSYPATGEPVTPKAKVEASEYGPGAWMTKHNLLNIGTVAYTNNTAPGTATASVEISVKNGETYTLTKTFIIEGEAAERIPGDISGDERVDMKDAIGLLEYLCGHTADINEANADVTGDGEVDVQDVLRILQYEAGWNVTLK